MAASSPAVDLRRASARVRRFFARIPATPEFVEPRTIALRFRAECAAYGPHEIAAAVGAPPECGDLRMIAYLFAHTVAPAETIELCVEQGIYGFHEWAAEQARR